MTRNCFFQINYYTMTWPVLEICINYSIFHYKFVIASTHKEEYIKLFIDVTCLPHVVMPLTIIY